MVVTIKLKKIALLVLCTTISLLCNLYISNYANAEKPKVTKEQCKKVFDRSITDDNKTCLSYWGDWKKTCSTWAIKIPANDDNYIDKSAKDCIDAKWIYRITVDGNKDLIFDELAAEHYNNDVTPELCSTDNIKKDDDAVEYFANKSHSHRILTPFAQACVDSGLCNKEEGHDLEKPYLKCPVADNIVKNGCARFHGKMYSDSLEDYPNKNEKIACVAIKQCEKVTSSYTLNCNNAKGVKKEEDAKTEKHKQDVKAADLGLKKVTDLYDPYRQLPDYVQNMERCQDNSIDFGWIVCPGINVVVKAVDGIAKLVEDSLKWTILADSGGHRLIDVWKKILSISNIFLVVMFIVALYVYTLNTTGVFGKYTIKVMLSRLIVVAAAMNVSFYVCAAAADLSNIAGSSIYGIITSKMISAHGGVLSSIGSAIGSLAMAIAILVLVILNFSTIASATVMILAILTMRQIALIALVIVSPVAIACHLLPNTEKWFKKWWDAYFKLLIVYPFFTAAWGATRLISNILNVTHRSNVVIDTIAAITPLLSIIPIFNLSGALMGKLSNLGRSAVDKSGMSNFAKDRDARRRKRIGNNIQSRSIGLQNRLKNSKSRFGRMAGSAMGHLNGTNAEARQRRAQDARDKAFNDTVDGINDKYTSAKMDKANDDVAGMSDVEVVSIATTGRASASSNTVDQYEYSAAVQEADRRNLINAGNYDQMLMQAQRQDSKLARKTAAESDYGRAVLGDSGRDNFINQSGRWNRGKHMTGTELNNAIDSAIQVNSGNINETDWLNMSTNQRALLVDRSIASGNATTINNINKINNKSRKHIDVYGSPLDSAQFNYNKTLISNARSGSPYTPGDAFSDGVNTF